MSIGTILLGKYRVESILGEGGMGVVAECTHLQLNERVAIKMLRQDLSLNREATERFMREAQAAVKLKSEYVARVSDVGTFESGIPYMVMEFLEGHDLGALLVERGRLPVPWAAELVLQTCEALAEAHSLGIVHRDIKPANLFVTWRPDGTALIKVLDFGISKSSMGTDMHLTQTQSLLGTPAYMSPEQMRSARAVDGRTDMWSLGTVLYELVEGRKPFEADSFSEMCVKVAVDAPSPMVHAPHELQEVILRCLAKAPEQRYANMAEFGRELVPFVQDGHQGAMLVERMQRMLRRGAGSGGDFDVSTGVNMRVPTGIRDINSSPVRVPTQPAMHVADARRSSPDGGSWHGGSEPNLSPWHGGSEPAGSALLTPQAPGAGAPLVTSAESPAPRRGPVILIGMLLTGVAGIAIAMTLQGTQVDTSAGPAAADIPWTAPAGAPTVSAPASGTADTSMAGSAAAGRGSAGSTAGSGSAGSAEGSGAAGSAAGSGAAGSAAGSGAAGSTEGSGAAGSAVAGSGAAGSTEGSGSLGSVEGSAAAGSAAAGSGAAGSAEGSAAPALGAGSAEGSAAPALGAGSRAGKTGAGKTGAGKTGAGKVIIDANPLDRRPVVRPPKADCDPFENPHGCPGSRRN